MKYTEEEKVIYWNKIIAEGERPRDITNARLEKLKQLVWNDDAYFWYNTIGRDRPDNFWSIVYEVAIQKGIIKP